MHIAGVLVHARPGAVAAVQARLGALPGVEIHAASPDGRVVVTIEGDGRQAVADALFAVNAVEGVLSAALVYEQSETES